MRTKDLSADPSTTVGVTGLNSYNKIKQKKALPTVENCWQGFYIIDG
jgi:hypothetical protein